MISSLGKINLFAQLFFNLIGDLGLILFIGAFGDNFVNNVACYLIYNGLSFAFR